EEIELELDIFECFLGDEAAAALTWSSLAADNRAALYLPARVERIPRRRARRCAAAWRDEPTGEVVAVEERFPGARRGGGGRQRSTTDGDERRDAKRTQPTREVRRHRFPVNPLHGGAPQMLASNTS